MPQVTPTNVTSSRSQVQCSTRHDGVESRSARRLGAALVGRSPSITSDFSLAHAEAESPFVSRRERPTPTSPNACVHPHYQFSMLMDPGHKQPKSVSSGNTSLSSDNTALWKNDANDVATLFFPANFLEPTTPETFLELDPAGFFTHSSSGVATKGSCASALGRAGSTQQTTPINCWAKLEPSREPCTDEIPWPDLVFWLGNVSTGEVSCSCAQCSRHAMRVCNAGLMRQHRYSPYHHHQQQNQQRRRVSSRVPVINLPRIEGVN